jgi:hypothetical protein
MTDEPTVLLGAAEGTGAEIAWFVVYALCWFFVVFPFVLWYCGVRTPRAERRKDLAREPNDDTAAPDRDEERAAVAG